MVLFRIASLGSRPSSRSSSSLDVTDFTDRQSRSRCRDVGGNQRHETWQTWQGRQSLCLAASAGVPCEWERRDEDFGVRMKTTGVTKLSAFHTNAPVLLFFPRQPSISIHDWPSFSGTDALPPPLILFLKKIRSKDFSLRLTLTLVLVHVRSLRSQVKDSKANHLKFKCRV
jgi:hypothetical protein